MRVSSYKFSDIKKKDFQSFNTIVNEKKLFKFIDISGDKNPLHSNKKFAKKLNFKSNIIHGLLISSFYSKLVGVYLPGKYSVIGKININFHNPLYINQKINVSGKVVAKDSRFKVITLHAKITRKDTLISSAEILVNVKK